MKVVLLLSLFAAVAFGKLRGEDRRLTEAREQEAWKKVYDHLFFAYASDPSGGPSVPDQGAGPLFEKTMFSLAQPGLSLDPVMFTDAWDPIGNPTGKNMNAAEFVADLFGEVIPSVDSIFKPKLGKVSEFYSAIVRAQNIHEPVNITEEEWTLYHRARAYLYANVTRMALQKDGTLKETTVEGASEYFTTYEDYQDAYLDAREDYYAAFEAVDLSDPISVTKWSTTSQTKLARLQRAWDKFLTFGNKDIVEWALAITGQFMASNIINEFRDARFQFEAMKTPSHRNPANTYMPTYVSPANFWDKDADFFSHVELSTILKSKHDESHYKETKGKAGGLYSAFTGAGDWSWSKNVETTSSTTDDFTVSFDYARIQIVRPWLKEYLFTLSNWKLLSRQPGHLSTGALDGTNNGDMPLLPHSFIVAKNFKIKADFSKEDDETITEGLETNTQFGWGPFSVKGSYKQDDKTYDFKGTYKTGELQGSQDPQVIGFFSKLMPFMPPTE